jgi:hypothetical protein
MLYTLEFVYRADVCMAYALAFLLFQLLSTPSFVGHPTSSSYHRILISHPLHALLQLHVCFPLPFIYRTETYGKLKIYLLLKWPTLANRCLETLLN